MSRVCGSCQACCHVKSIPGFMESWSDCAHQCAAGCSLYVSRPAGCRRYTCAWLDGWGEEADRPDRSGLIVESTPGPFGKLLARGVEARPGAGDEPRAQAALEEWAALGAEVTLQRYGER